MNPSITLSELGFPDTTFEQDVQIAQTLRIAGVSPDESKLVEPDIEHYRSVLDASNVAAAICSSSILTILPSPSTGFDSGPDEVEARIELMTSAIRRMAPLSPYCFLFITGPAGERSDRTARSIVIEGIQELERVGRDCGMRLALEPMRESYRPDWTFVTTLGEASDLLDEAGATEAGMVLDTWHLWDSEDIHTEIRGLADRVLAVQIADYRDPTRSPLDRVVAGDGIGRIPELLTTLRRAGFDGWYDLEVFSDDGRFGVDHPDSLWKLPPDEYARRQVAGFLRCWEQSEA